MKKFFVLSLLFLALPSMAAVTPKGAKKDNRIQYVTYDADNVIRIRTRLGISTLIQLSAGETLESPTAGLGIGDEKAWKIGVKGHNIFLKPSAVSPETNITLVTNKRTYAISLETVNENQNPAYIVRFIYPEIEAMKQKQKEKFPNEAPCSLGPKNENYVMWGDLSLAPYAAWNDGKFTCFRYPTDKDLPAFFRKMPDGKEAIVNYHIQDDVVVIHEINKEYRLRLGDFVLGIENTNEVTEGVYNSSNTHLLLRERKEK